MRDGLDTGRRPAHVPGTPREDTPRPEAGRTSRRVVGLLVALGALVVAVGASLVFGANPIPLHTVVHALLHSAATPDGIVVRGQRVPRTLLGLTVGAALGLAGALMQALTRNPIADPGLLGVNSGASAALVCGIGFFGLTSPLQYIWLALAGAAIVAAVVYVLGTRGRGGATPAGLALAGIAISAVCTSFIQAILLLQPRAFDAFRFWQTGALTGRGLDVLYPLLPFVAAGAALAGFLARPLNALALGEEVGRALGVRAARTRVLGVAAITLLCGAATAAAGPIWFIGLAVPHMARAVTGPDQRWVMGYSAVLAPALLLGADVTGRVIARPGEIEVGIVTAVLGAPVLIALARRRRVPQL